MRVLIPVIAIVGGVVVGTAAGLVLRHSAALQGTGAGGSAESNSTAAALSAGRKTPAEIQASSTVQASESDRNLSMSTGVTRWLYWWDAIEKAGPSDFPRLARLAEGNRVATRLVAERWAELAPKQFFEALRSAAKQGNKFSWEFSQVLFSTWLKKDKAAAIGALNGDENFPERNTWRQDVASSLMDSDPETGLRMMSQWHIENYGPSMKGVRTWAAADPRHAAEFTMSNPAGYASQEAMQIIGETWAKTAPAQALEFATAQRGDLGKSLAEMVLKSWAERDLNQAADWLANSDPATLKKFSPSFVEAWSKQDASSALAWCEANLAGSSLMESVRNVFNGAAQKDVASAAALVNSMDPSPARSQAAAAVADKWFPNTFDSKPVPPETIAWLSSLDPDSMRSAADKVSWKWSETDPSSMAAFLQSATNVSFPASAYENLARTMARNDPASALDWANHLPQQLGVVAGSSAFGEWGRSQFDAAIQWYNQLPALDPRHEPFLTSLLQVLVWDPQADDRFAKAAALAPSSARAILQGMSLSQDRRAALMAHLSSQAR